MMDPIFTSWVSNERFLHLVRAVLFILYSILYCGRLRLYIGTALGLRSSEDAMGDAVCTTVHLSRCYRTEERANDVSIGT